MKIDLLKLFDTDYYRELKAAGMTAEEIHEFTKYLTIQFMMQTCYLFSSEQSKGALEISINSDLPKINSECRMMFNKRRCEDTTVQLYTGTCINYRFVYKGQQ